MKILVPKVVAASIFAVGPEWLHEKGITLLLLDLDNTLATYAEDMPKKCVLDWLESLRAAGISLYIISNSRKARRVDDYAAACGLAFVKGARKPKPEALQEIMRKMGKTPAETALMGDQIFTDGLAANRAGVSAIVVRPLGMKNPLFFLRYLVELPFRRRSEERL